MRKTEKGVFQKHKRNKKNKTRLISELEFLREYFLPK